MTETSRIDSVVEASLSGLSADVLQGSRKATDELANLIVTAVISGDVATLRGIQTAMSPAIRHTVVHNGGSEARTLFSITQHALGALGAEITLDQSNPS